MLLKQSFPQHSTLLALSHTKKTDSTIVLLSPLLANFYQLSYTAKMSLLAQLNYIGTERATALTKLLLGPLHSD